MELSLRVRSDMRYFFAIVVGSMMLGCTERNNQHVELRSGEAAEASRLIKSLGGLARPDLMLLRSVVACKRRPQM